MSKIKKILKNILIYIPVINYLFILFNYKIMKIDLSIHKYKIGKMLMTKNNYQIYDRINAGKITGLDNEMNYEYAFSKKIIELADKNKVFFDIGASYGHYSSLACKLFKEVYCFEGDPLELYFLKKNLKQFKNVKIINKFLTKNFNIDKIIKQTGVIPFLIKIDVEGDEIQILENCQETLKIGPNFLIEFHKRKILNQNKNDSLVIENFFSIFSKNGYRLKFNGHHDYENLISYGIPDKEWNEKRPITNNFAVLATKI